MSDFKLYNHLGFHNPYFLEGNSEFLISDNITDILKKTREKKIDLAAVTQLLNKSYIFGDRTLVQNINKTPWMAKPNTELNGWEFYDLPPHSENISTEEEIAQEFYQRLKNELLGYISQHSRIGILLTGGMDSRIVACVLNDVIASGELTDKKVLAMTWGNKNSRDVVYAERISKLFGWDWEHYVVDGELMLKNIDCAAENGCEYSPIHLHAMPEIAERKDLDCIVAGSFGDSIGRGEYSGVKVKNLKNLNVGIDNPAGLLRSDYKELTEQEINRDIEKYHQLFPQEKDYMMFEQDLQLHYMRRMLNPCMAVIHKNIPLYQMFSSPEVFGYMWSLNPDLRTDKIYELLLSKNNKKLLEIPWARTGLVYPNKTGDADQLTRSHHDYGNLIRNELFGVIKNEILSGHLEQLNVFDISAVKKLLMLVDKLPIQRSFVYEEKLIWLAALSKFVSKYQIKGLDKVQRNNPLKKEQFLYLLRYIKTKIK